LAESVLATIERQEKVGPLHTWKLAPGAGDLLEKHDLSQLDWSFESAWAPLAAGLLMATWGTNPKKDVWATGGYKAADGGMVAVDHLAEKAEAAWRLGARVLFVPRGQRDDAQKAVSDRRLSDPATGQALQIGELGKDSSRPSQTLKEYLAQLELPPDREAPKGVRAGYFMRVPDFNQAQDYYRRFILPDVLKDNLPLMEPVQGNSLVTLVSKSLPLVELAIGLVRPASCLLLHNKELAEEARKLSDTIRSEDYPCKFRLMTRQFDGEDYQALLEEFKGLIAEFLGEASSGDLVADLTAGQRVMNLALYDAVPPGSYIVCCQAEQHQGRPKPFTERISIWQKGVRGNKDNKGH